MHRAEEVRGPGLRGDAGGAREGELHIAALGTGFGFACRGWWRKGSGRAGSLRGSRMGFAWWNKGR